MIISEFRDTSPHLAQAREFIFSVNITVVSTLFVTSTYYVVNNIMYIETDNFHVTVRSNCLIPEPLSLSFSCIYNK